MTRRLLSRFIAFIHPSPLPSMRGDDTSTEEPPMPHLIRMTWRRRFVEDARAELAERWNSRPVWQLRMKLRHLDWAIEGMLLRWTQDAEPGADYCGRLLAEDEWGDWVVPSVPLFGEPRWCGRWRWWKPTHWPVYVRSRVQRSYVMVECA